MQIKYQHEKLKICKWWLDRGFYLLPAQVGKKYLFQGWGEYKRKITDIENAIGFFDSRQSLSNVAVLVNDGLCVLDFDDAELYENWANTRPEISRTYTERTPRGGAHVFLRASAPAGLVLVAGVELKRICLVAPSVVEGKPYTRGEGEIIGADPERVFFSLSKPGTRTVRLLNLEKRYPAPVPASDMIGKIKSHWSTVQVFQTYRPDITLKKSGDVYSALCPFHKDHRPSLFINSVTGFWKCHACGASGDVINAYARFQNIPNREAIARMARALEVQ